MRRPTLVGLVALSLVIPQALAQDAGAAARPPRPPRPPQPPRFVAAFRWVPLAPPRSAALLPGGRLGLRTSAAAVAAAWNQRVRAVRPRGLAAAATVPAVAAESLGAPPAPPITPPSPADIRRFLGAYADLGMELRVRFELKADRFRNLKCSPFEQQQVLSGCQAKFPTISPVPQYSVRTTGVVGRRLHVNVDFDSQREFDANNNLQVWYAGLEDDILKRVEAGNVTFRSPRSRFITAAIPANNFGVQAVAQIGSLELTGIYAQQKGNVVKDRLYDVGETTTQPLDRVARDLDYEQGRFFFAVDPGLVPAYPAVDILNIDPLSLPDSLRVGSLRVYRMRAVAPGSSSNQNIGGVRAVACGATANAVDCSAQRAGPFQWEILQEGKDYYVDPTGAWFALATRLDQSDYLAVSYVPAGATSCAPGGGPRCVGTFPVAANPDTAFVDTLRLVYDPKPGVTAAAPSFRFEIRSAYRVGGSEITRETAQLALTVNQRELTLLTGETYLALLGMALESDPTKFDEYNRLFPRARDPQQGAPLRDYFAVFPHLAPFADSSRLAAAERNDSLYRTPRAFLALQAPPSVFALRLEASVSASADKSQLSLNSFQIRDGSEKIYVGTRLLTRDADYTIDYATGQVQFRNADSLFQGGAAQVRAQFEERAAFAIAPTSIYGLAARYDLGARGQVNLTGLFQREQSAFTRPPLGFEPSSSFIGGVSTELHFQPEVITRALNLLPGINTDAPSLLNVAAEVALSRPRPNQAGQAYIEEFEGEAGRFISLAENSWHWGSRPTSPRGAEPFGISTFDPADAAALTWQGLPIDFQGRPIQFLSQQIDPTIRVVGQAQSAEPVLWLMLKPDTVLGLADANSGAPNWVRPHRDGARWRSITQPLSATGVDLSRVEYIEFWVWEDNHRTAKANRAALLLDFGSVFEDALAWVPEYFTHAPQGGDTAWYGQRFVGLGRLDTERDPLTRSWDAVTNDAGILSDSVTDGIIDSTDVRVVPNLPLCSASRNGVLQVWGFGDLRSRCGRRNGFVDTEDLDGDFQVDSVAGARTSESFVRYVFPIGDERFYVRDGGMIPVQGAGGNPDGAAGWRLYRIPFRADTIQEGGVNLRQIQSLRITVLAPQTAPPGRPSPQVFLGLARVRLVGASWLKRAEAPIRGIAGDRGVGLGEVIASVVSTENRDLGYTPPPGVFDQAGRRDANLQLAAAQINERSLRLLATGLETGQRAEAFTRFTSEGDKNFLKYRKLRAWARGRGPGWEDGDLHFYIKAGKDQNNFYLYHAGARTSSWEPEVVVEFDRWLGLRAHVEQAWLRGDTAQVYPGCPDTTLVPRDSAYVMCDGPYIAHVRDPATAPPNLAAVQEIAAGILRVDDRVFVGQAELWVDDIRLSDVVQDVGTAAAVDLTLTAANVADVAVSWSRRDAQFRQLGEDPRYQTDNAASVAATVRLERVLPDRWGIAVPLTVRHASLSTGPSYLAGTDIRANALPGLRTPRSTATSYALSIRRTSRSSAPLMRYLVDPLALAGALASGNTRADLSSATSSNYSLSLDYVLALVSGRPKNLRIVPTAVRFRSSLAGARGSRFTYAVPVARLADTALVPAQSRSKVWRTNAGLDFLPLPGVQLRMDAASLRDLRDYGDSTTIGRLMRQQRRSFLGANAGVETQRSVNTSVSVTPQVAAWLRPRANFSTAFTFNRDPNGRDAIRDGGDSTGGFHVPAAFTNSRRLDVGMQLDPQRFGQRVFGDSAALTKLLRRLTNVDVSYGRTQASSYNRAPFIPSLRYQLALVAFDRFRSQGGLLAGSAVDNWNLNAAGSAVFVLGARVNLNYRTTHGVAWARRTDRQVPVRTSSREWPSGTLTWSLTPSRIVLGRVLASVNAQFAYRENRTTAEQLSFAGGTEGAAVATTWERSVRPLVSLTWRRGINTTIDASRTKSDRVNAGNLFHTERDQQSASLSFAFRPPASLVRMKGDIRATARYSSSVNTVCLRSTGQTTCVPYVDSRQSQTQLTMDTDLPPSFSAGIQMAHVVNDERQANRKTSQLVITAFVELHTSVGQLR